MESIGIIFQSVSCLLALLAAAILLWVNQDRNHSNRMLVLLLLVLFIINFNGVLFHTGWYLKYPGFHKIAIPFSLLIFPAAYLYTKSVLQGELKFRKYDWLLLLPAFLFALNLLPYYIMTIADKRVYLVEYYKKSSLRSSESEGMLPAYFFSFARVVWSVLFIILNYQLMIQFKKQPDKKVVTDNATLLKWLTQLNGMLAALLAVALFAAIIAPVKKTVFNLPDIALGSFVLLICLKLFIKPKILYGVYQPASFLQKEHGIQLPAASVAGEVFSNKEEIKSEAIIEDKSSALIMTPEEACRYKQMVEGFFLVHQPFLKPGYSLEQLVADVNVPRYVLSAFINREYGMGFREFINRYRVEYMISKLDKPEWKQFTLEAIAAECGFNSRITFFKNFKQITGQSPSEYIRKKQKNDQAL